jgi:hypothetical protein
VLVVTTIKRTTVLRGALDRTEKDRTNAPN